MAIRTLVALVALTVPATAVAHEPWVTEYNTGLLPTIGAWDITAADDDDLWFTQELQNTFGRITTDALITDFPGALLGGSPKGITAGPDGNIWVAESAGDGAIARVTPTGVATEFTPA